MASATEDVYATLLLNDFYLPGALVLGHSLRDAGTTKKLAVLVTTDTVSADAMAELQKLFDYIVPVERVTTDYPDNLYLMNRPDLHSTFTKITLWKQLQFRRIVYVDADMVALRAPDELFDLPQAFSAAPDIGWPDIFNTGLMVLTPNMGDYYALLAMAQRGISFDGADQGLLNMHFKNSFNRLSFTYNVTPSAHYQYLPAFRHFQSSISMAHFIGQNKPWNQGREASKGSTPYDEMVGRWWAVYDRHYRESVSDTSNVTETPLNSSKSVKSTPQGASTIVHYHTKGEYQPPVPIASINQPEPTQSEPNLSTKPPLYETTEIHTETDEPYESYESQNPDESHEPHESHESHESHEVYAPLAESVAEQEVEKQPEIEYSTWDPSKAPPPTDSKPEASNFPATHYSMSSDPTPFVAPERYPDPPKDMYYEVPKTPTYQKPAPIFPWEINAPKPTRVFPEDNATYGPHQDEELVAEAAVEEGKTSPVIPATPTTPLASADPWQSYTRGNAWDDIPEIERYIGNLQKNRKGNIQVLQGYGTGIEDVSSPGGRRRSIKLTDFPTELERPSLPVTPAPIRRPSFWGDERDADGKLPAAEGVPSQEEWDPAIQLEQLARRQSDVLASKLGNDAPPREIPLRPLPYGSEGVQSPTYVAQVPPSGTTGAGSTPRNANTIEAPSFKGPGFMWEKDETFPTKETPVGPTDEELDVLQT